MALGSRAALDRPDDRMTGCEGRSEIDIDMP